MGVFLLLLDGGGVMVDGCGRGEERALRLAEGKLHYICTYLKSAGRRGPASMMQHLADPTPNPTSPTLTNLHLEKSREGEGGIAFPIARE